MNNLKDSDLFHLVEDAQAVTVSAGTYKQVKVYLRGGLFYVQHGGGYVYVTKSGTSNPKVTIAGWDVPIPHAFTSLGRMCKVDHPDAKYKQDGKPVLKSVHK